MTKRILLTLAIAALTLSACGGTDATPAPALDPNVAMTLAFATVNASFTQTAQAIPITPPPPTETPTPTAPPQPTAFAPTSTLPVTISAPANCRFGPDTVYAGPGGLRTGKVLEAIGRDTSEQWFLLREPGGKNSCWVNIIALSIQGDINTLSIAPIQLVYTANYPSPPNVTATRSGDQVQISWGEVPLTPQVTYIESHYFLELWLCNAGQLTYSLFATNDLFITVTDQPGCAEAPHGLIHTTTREGYSQPATIPWPAP
jgi:hypothetical protein